MEVTESDTRLVIVFGKYLVVNIDVIDGNYVCG